MKKVRRLTLLLVVLLQLGLVQHSYSTDQVGTQDDVKLSMNAVGKHRYIYAMFFKLYDASLYTDAVKTTNIDELLNGENALLLEFEYLRKIKKSIILESSEKILAKNMTSAELDLIQERVDRINAAYRTVDKGDRSALSYIPGKGTTLWINERPIITIGGEDFARLYFRIWLGEEPISKPMRNALLRHILITEV